MDLGLRSSPTPVVGMHAGDGSAPVVVILDSEDA